MPGTLTLSIGLGLLVSLGMSEVLGLTAGGLIVPGYIALFLDKPIVVVSTLVVSVITFFLVNSLATVTIIYGRRRTALMILIAFALGALLNNLNPAPDSAFSLHFAVAGHIIPGLIAIWMDRQGILECIASILIASCIVRLLLIVFVGKVVI